MARILVIDDEELARFTLREILEGNSHVVTEAGDGIEGVQCLEKESFDLAIADMVMSRQEGPRTIEAIKGLVPDLKVLAISRGRRFGNADSHGSALEAGADAFLRKPFSYQEFVDTVAYLTSPTRIGRPQAFQARLRN
jgi:CheY-like chemotaxis protein